MDEKQYKKLSSDLDILKKLLALLLRNQDVRGDAIANAMGITEGRLSQMISNNKKSKRKSRVSTNNEA